jgi:hypothetical protein
LGAIEKGFLDKYQNRTATEWGNDPVWKRMREHYKTIGTNQPTIVSLEKLIADIQASQAKRYKGYGDVGKHPASIVLTVGILPLIILAIYGVDRAINGIDLQLMNIKRVLLRKRWSSLKLRLKVVVIRTLLKIVYIIGSFEKFVG